MTELSPRGERKRRRPYQIGQVVEQVGMPTGKRPKDTRWDVFRWRVDKHQVEAWQLVSTKPNIPTQEQLSPQKPPEVIREETQKAKIEDWKKITDI